MVKGVDIDKYWVNEVNIRGRFGKILSADRGKHSGENYVSFHIRVETLDVTNGLFRANEITCRAYDNGIQALAGATMEDDLVTISGEIVAPQGAGGMFVLVKSLELTGKKKTEVSHIKEEFIL